MQLFLVMTVGVVSCTIYYVGCIIVAAMVAACCVYLVIVTVGWVSATPGSSVPPGFCFSWLYVVLFCFIIGIIGFGLYYFTFILYSHVLANIEVFPLNPYCAFVLWF